MRSTPLRPRPHQVEAIAAVSAHLEHSERASIVLPCGAGKTLVGRLLAEDRQASVTLVVVPSLALIAQTLAEWCAAGGWRFEPLIICSDPSTAVGAQERARGDQIDSDDATAQAVDGAGEQDRDLGPLWARHRAHVTTSVSRAARVLEGRIDGRPTVVFSTYHSVAVAAEAAHTAGVSFDLVIADEAHNLAGRPRKEFRVVLGDELPARARVFMTATQLTAAAASPHAVWEEELAPVSMDDIDLFGPVVYRMDFAEAIDQGLLSDYQVVVYETAGENASDPVAALLAAATTCGGVSRVLSFHGRVAKARGFAAAVDGTLLPDGRRVRAVAVAGTDPAAVRARCLRLLEDPDPSVLVVVASARCLSEGVDVPVVDGVLFADPKASDVGIIQSVGRVLRLGPGKDLGKVLIPVCYRPDLDEDTTLSTSSFASVWRILRGLRSVDARVAAELDTCIRPESHRGRSDGSRGPAVVRFALPSMKDLGSLVARLVSETSGVWEERFAELAAYAAEHGTANPPSSRARLWAWCASQRKVYAKGMLLPDRAAALRGLPGWTWDAEMRVWTDQWKEVYAATLSCVGGRLDVEDVEAMGRRLRTRSGRNRATTVGRWCALQRISARRGDLDAERRHRLEQLPGWSWQVVSPATASYVDLLGEYVAWKGTANPPAGYVEDDLPLGRWLRGLRRAKVLGTVSQALVDELDLITPNRGSSGALRWETRETQWRIGLEVLGQYVAREGRCRMPENWVEDFHGTSYQLYAWCRLQRHDHRYGNLDPDRVEALEQVPGWAWEVQRAPRVLMDIDATPHGTRRGYVKGCLCDRCTAANTAAQAERESRARAGGPTTDLVPAAPARGHLRILAGRGASQKQLARAADLNVKTIVELLDGTSARIHPETEKIVLALTFEAVTAAVEPGTTVPAGPTWELLDSLVRRGWPKSWIARELGLTVNLWKRGPQVRASTVRLVEDLYARLDGVAVPARSWRSPLPRLDQILNETTGGVRPGRAEPATPEVSLSSRPELERAVTSSRTARRRDVGLPRSA